MNPEIESEILELMDKLGLTYDEAVIRWERRNKQIELATERTEASSTNKKNVAKKHQDFKEARDSLNKNQ